MRIRVEHALAKWEELTIELPESKPTFLKTVPAFEVVSAIVYECAVRKQPILPCTFTIKKLDGEYFITDSDLDSGGSFRYESGEKPMIVEINNPRNSHLIKSVAIPDLISNEVEKLPWNPQNIDVLIKLLRGVDTINFLCLDKKRIDRLNLIVAESLTLNRLCIAGVTEKGATPLIKMLTENTKLNHFEIADISCSNEQVKANLFTQLINALENNLSFKDFNILKYYRTEFHYLALEAKLRKSARLAYLQFCLRNQRPQMLPLIIPLIQAIYEHLSPLLIKPLIHVIYEYLSPDDLLASVDLNSAFMYYLMPQVPWKKQNDQGVYTLDFSSEKELLDFHQVLPSQLNSLVSVVEGKLNSVERCLIKKRVAEAETLGFDEYYHYIKKQSGFPNRIYLKIPVQLWICIFAIGEKLLEQFKSISILKTPCNEYGQFVVCSGSKKQKREQEQLQVSIKNSKN